MQFESRIYSGVVEIDHKDTVRRPPPVNTRESSGQATSQEASHIPVIILSSRVASGQEARSQDSRKVTSPRVAIGQAESLQEAVECRFIKGKDHSKPVVNNTRI